MILHLTDTFFLLTLYTRHTISNLMILENPHSNSSYFKISILQILYGYGGVLKVEIFIQYEILCNSFLKFKKYAV